MGPPSPVARPDRDEGVVVDDPPEGAVAPAARIPATADQACAAGSEGHDTAVGIAQHGAIEVVVWGRLRRARRQCRALRFRYTGPADRCSAGRDRWAGPPVSRAGKTNRSGVRTSPSFPKEESGEPSGRSRTSAWWSSARRTASTTLPSGARAAASTSRIAMLRTMTRPPSPKASSNAPPGSRRASAIRPLVAVLRVAHQEVAAALEQEAAHGPVGTAHVHERDAVAAEAATHERCPPPRRCRPRPRGGTRR